MRCRGLMRSLNTDTVHGLGFAGGIGEWLRGEEVAAEGGDGDGGKDGDPGGKEERSGVEKK